MFIFIIYLFFLFVYFYSVAPKKAIKTIQVWEQDIENMFKYDITNGVVERINRTIKQSKNIAYGYRNLERATKLVQYRVNKCTLKVS